MEEIIKNRALQSVVQENLALGEKLDSMSPEAPIKLLKGLKYITIVNRAVIQGYSLCIVR
jgi:hypothetical protein